MTLILILTYWFWSWHRHTLIVAVAAALSLYISSHLHWITPLHMSRRVARTHEVTRNLLRITHDFGNETWSLCFIALVGHGGRKEQALLHNVIKSSCSHQQLLAPQFTFSLYGDTTSRFWAWERRDMLTRRNVDYYIIIGLINSSHSH